jgi:tetratricopeptide (TPR) repeat protein
VSFLMGCLLMDTPTSNDLAAEACLARGMTCCNTQDWRGAIEAFSDALGLRSRYSEAYYRRSIARLYLGDDLEAAVEDAERGYRTKQSWYEFQAAYKHGGGREDRDFLNDILKAYSDFIARYPDVAQVYGARGFAYWDREMVFDAIHDFSEMIRLQPDNAEAYLWRGDAYRWTDFFGRESDSHATIADYDEAIRLEPNNPLAYYARGTAHSSKNKDKVFADLSEAIRLKAYFPIEDEAAYLTRIYKTRAVHYVANKEFDKALDDLTEALRLTAEVDSYKKRGNLLVQMGRLDEAIADYEAALKIMPDDERVQQWLADTLRKKAGQ